MADAVAANYNNTLKEALEAREEWLEKSELAKLKEELRIYQVSYSVLYNIFLKKKLIHEDPYKQDTKISELEVPETGAFNEAKRLEQISLRLANYDNQLDFLVNFYQFGISFMNLERIRRIVGLVRYIEWTNLTPDSKSPNTMYVAELVNSAKTGADALSLNIINEAQSKLPKCTTAIMKILRDISAYHKELYKLNVRTALPGLQASDATPVNIKKKMGAAMARTPFYQEFIEELIREDFTKDGPALQEAILKSLQVAEAKPKATKPKVSYKDILLNGIRAIGASATVLAEIAQKVDDNELILESQKKGLWEKIKKILKSMVNANPDELIYDLHFFDEAKGTEKWEPLNFHQFRADFDRKMKVYTGMSGQGPFLGKLSALSEEQILGYLERAIRDLQTIYRILTALDEFFKSSIAREERDKIKGIKPELAAMKNCFVKANLIRHDYSAQKEEEEQMKRLGINPA